MHKIKDAYRKVLLHKGDVYLLEGEATQCIFGAAVRTSEKAPNPVFISQGHRITLASAIHVVLATCPNYRIPEPIRAADLSSRDYIRQHPLFPDN
jgi:deoxyribonuclease V